MTLEATYWILLGAGLGLLVLSMLVGDALDFMSFLDLDFGGDFGAAPVFYAAASAFGGGGLLALNAFETGTGASVLVGLATGVVIGAITAFFFAALGRQEAKDTFTTTELVGLKGRCSLAIGPGKVGRITISHGGMTRTMSATSSETISAGEDVVVVDAVGGSLKVARANTTSSSEQGQGS